MLGDQIINTVKMIASVVVSLLMIAVLFIIPRIFNRLFDDEEISYVEAFGENGFHALLAGVILLWFIPFGILIIFPVAILLSILSPAGRQSWHHFGRIRIYAIASMMVILMLGGLAPTADPRAPQSWGEPLFDENPKAPLYPSGKQFTWLMLPSDGGLNVEIVQSLSVRTPHQFTKFSAASSTLLLADLLNMQQSRLDQAVQLLDEQIVFDLDEDEMKLVPIKDKKTHTYDVNSNQKEVQIRLFELRSLTLSSNPDGVKVGEIFCAAESSWRGELDVLVVVRPIGHTGLSSDRYAERLTAQWIAS